LWPLAALILGPTLALTLSSCSPKPDPPGDAQPAKPALDSGASAEAPVAVPGTPADYVTEVEAWRDQRLGSLTAENGWLSLVGLYWLEPGDNTFGSTPDNSLIFPEKAPNHAGTFHLVDGKVTVDPAPGAQIALADDLEAPVAGKVLTSDAEGEPSVLTLGSLRFYVIQRGDRVGIRVKDAGSPARTGFTGLDYFPIDPAWKVEAHLERTEGATVPVPNVLGQVEDAPSPGTLTFELPGGNGRTFSLHPILEEGSDELFIVFGDPTNGRLTYGGGRFLYADAPGPDGKVVLDFNRAYNPPCSFTPYATCPLPPPGNKLSIPVTAGEEKYAHGIPHHEPGTPAARNSAS
jgi:uncharacterized protein (DUF1684 family)